MRCKVEEREVHGQKKASCGAGHGELQTFLTLSSKEKVTSFDFMTHSHAFCSDKHEILNAHSLLRAHPQSRLSVDASSLTTASTSGSKI